MAACFQETKLIGDQTNTHLGVLLRKYLVVHMVWVFHVFSQGPLANMDSALDNFPFLVWPQVVKVFSVAKLVDIF